MPSRSSSTVASCPGRPSFFSHYLTGMVNPAEHIGIVHAIANKKLRGYGRRFDVEDLVHEGVIGMMSAARKFDPQKGRFGTYAAWWIHASIDAYIVEKGGRLVQLPIKMARKLNREAALPTSPVEFFDNEHPAEVPTPAETYEKSETAAIVWCAVAHLNDPKDAEIVRMYFKEGMDMPKIGKRLGMSRQGVQQRLEKALKDLKPYLKKRLEK